MKLIFSLTLLGVLSVQLKAQLYFPPNNSSQWKNISPATLSWCQERIDSLYNFLDYNNTKAFILLKDVLYFDKQIESDNLSFSLFNSIGQLVDSNKFLRSLNVSGFPDGLYYLRLSNGHTNYSQTIIKE
jgi:hypothetical protein